MDINFDTTRCLKCQKKLVGKEKIICTRCSREIGQGVAGVGALLVSAGLFVLSKGKIKIKKS